MGDVEVQFGPQPAASRAKAPQPDAMQRDLFEAAAMRDTLPEDEESDEARELRAMVKAHEYWQRKPSAAQANPFEDS